MSKDRRTDERLPPDRRRSGRIPDYRRVLWRADGDPALRSGLLVEWSGHGVTVLTEAHDTPQEGARLVPRKRSDLRGWRKPAVVTRVEPLPGGFHRVAAEFPDSVERISPFKWVSRPDRRADERAGAGRRRSSRWETDKTLAWRVSRGRRVRESRVVERSLDGLVLAVEPRDAAPEGSRFFPYGAEPADRFGFRSAIVRRTEAPNEDYRLVFAEIEA
jgi:hypothetical protein